MPVYYSSPYLNHFSQPDTIIPDASNPQSFNRYSYALNNPVRYNDPSGHCPICFFSVIAAFTIYSSYAIPNALGTIPDYRGILNAELFMDSKNDSIEVAAGIAVQSEWSGLADTIIGDVMPGSSGYGLAQTNAEEISALGLGKLNPQNPYDAVQVMQARIAAVQDACIDCSSKDLFYAAALAQNKGITPKTMRDLSAPEGKIDWDGFFGDPRKPGQIDARIRQSLTGIQYDTKFMLLKYVRNVRVLNHKGWALPDGINGKDLDDFEKFAKSK